MKIHKEDTKMKKWVVSIVTAVLVIGIGSVSVASAPSDGKFNFGDMLPFMKQMHPNLSDQQLEDMFNNCHQNNQMNHSNMMNSL